MSNYTIQSGDTLSDIAQAHGISVKDLADANNIPNVNAIKAGDSLSIPSQADLAANKQSKDLISEVVAQCPLRAQWLTIKPLRYAVADDDSEAALPDDFNISGDMPVLKQHKYTVRELVEQYVYLYHPKEHYLLEVHYQNAEVPYLTNQVVGRCVFGTLDQTDPDEKNVSTALAKSPALLKQKKGDKVIMWLTHAPLSQSRITLLQENPTLIDTLGQHIDLATAAKDQQDNAFPLFNAKHIMGELLATQETQMTWTALSLVTGLDEHCLNGDHNKETPDNSYGVTLIDPIGIATDLCREFSIAYEMVMNSLTAAQHPFQMATLTRAIINKEAAETRGAPYNEAPFRRLAEKQHELDKSSRLFMSKAAIANADKEFEARYKIALEEQRNRHNKDAEERYQAKKAELESHVHSNEMDALLTDHNDGMAQIKETLDNLAEDWLSWLKHDQLDAALSLLDDTSETQRALKEMLVAAMVNNINAVDDGVALVTRWVSNLGTQLQQALGQAPVTMSGVEAHFFLSLGYGATDTTKAILSSSAMLKAINGMVAAIRTEVEKDYEALMGSQKVLATPATEVLVETLTTHLTQQTIRSQSGQLLWQETIATVTRRYGRQFTTVTMPLGEVVEDMHASYAAMTALSAGHVIQQQTQATRQTAIHSLKNITLYDLEQSAPTGDPFTRNQAQYPRFMAKHMKASEVWLSSKQGLKDFYEKTNKLFSSASQAKLLGVFTLLQVYNTIKLYDAMQADDSFKNQTAYYTALLSVSTTSLALVDKVFSKSFAGESFTGYMKQKGAMAAGEKVTNSLKHSHKAAWMAKVLDVSAQKQAEAFERFGKLTARFINGAFRFVPILGGIAALFSSSVKVYDVWGEQNTKAVGLSVTALLLNGFALGALVLAFFFSGAILMPLAVVLAGLAVVLDIVYSFVADDQVTLLLKHSYWGKASYQYLPSLTTLDEKADHFATLTTDEIPSDTLKGLTSELRAFCDYLFKPLVRILKQSKDHQGYSQFTVQIGLPSFVKGQSDVSLSVTGKYGATGRTLLATLSADNRWQDNQLNGKIQLEDRLGVLTFTIDERQLDGYAIHNTGQASRNNKGVQGRNYQSYDMTLEYHQPAGIPISLSYPKITIDDDKLSWAFWRNNTEVEEFKAATQASKQDKEYEIEYWHDKMPSL